MALEDGRRDLRKLKLDTSGSTSGYFGSTSPTHDHSDDQGGVVRTSSPGDSPRPSGHVFDSKEDVKRSTEQPPLQRQHADIETGTIESHPINISQQPYGNVNGSLKDIFERRSSITFNPRVTLDDGDQRSIGEALPRRTDTSAKQADSIMPDSNGSDAYGLSPHTGFSKYNTSNSSFNERQREAAWSPSSSISLLSPISKAEEHNHVPSLASTTDSPRVESFSTSPTYGNGEFSLSPSIASSPGQFPSLAESGALSSPRNIDMRRNKSFQQLERNGSLRRFSRRSSTRSIASVAKSPASAFLSRWSRDVSTPPDPDEEGQAIGYQNEYIIGRQVGFGGFSIVKEVSTIEKNEQVKRAVKIVRKQLSGRSHEENQKVQGEFEHEVYIWCHLSHRHVAPLLAVFVDPFATWCITTLLTGGTLWDLVRTHRKTTIPTENIPTESSDLIVEPERYTGILVHVAKRYIYQLASAVQYLHEEKHIVHRDLKLENCLLDLSSSSSEDWGNLQLCDFGLADFVEHDDRDDFENEAMLNPMEDESTRQDPCSETTNSIVGSLFYASPELIKSKKYLYQASADMWSFGVVCYALLASDLPFSHSLMPKVQMMILSGDWNVQNLKDALEAQRDGVSVESSEQAIQLVHQCLSMDVSRRWTINNVMECAFLRGERGPESV